MPLPCFKAYDIRGKLGSELNENIAYQIGRAYGYHFQPRQVVVGADIRLSSETLKQALTNGLVDSGANVIDIGLAGTEEVYFATFHLETDGGIEVTASHNPMDYNGMKLVREHAKPVSGDSGLKEIEKLVEKNDFPPPDGKGQLTHVSVLQDYADHLLTYIDAEQLRPLRVVVNSGNGAAGHVIDALDERLPSIEFIRVHHEPDGNFPNGIPNPLLPENRADTRNAVLEHEADMGIAWDGDFDRCFLFNEQGAFIEGYYIVGLLAKAFLDKHPGEKIIHDPRLTWNTIDMVRDGGGTAIQSKTGHAFIKERMRRENAIYGGEMSAHHYFRDFAYCDSGMIPWLLVAELMSTTGKPLSELVQKRIAAYPCSGELNFTVNDSQAAIESLRRHFEAQNPVVDETDGLSLEFNDWRFNIRASNTEPLLRLNVESCANAALMKDKTREISRLLANY